MYMYIYNHTCNYDLEYSKNNYPSVNTTTVQGIEQAWRGMASDRARATARDKNHFRGAVIAHLGHKNSSPRSHL